MPRVFDISVETQRLSAQLRDLNLARPEASAAASSVMGRFFVELMLERGLAPRDTNRYVNGWIEAGRDAGVWTGPPLALNAGSKRDRYLEQLEAQLVGFEREYKKWDRYIGLYQREGGRRTKQPYYRKMLRRRRKAERRALRVIEEFVKLSDTPHAIVFSSESLAQQNQNRKFTTVRDTVYGGEGRRAIVNGLAVVELRNLEPHARIVERIPHHGHPVRSAMKILRQLGAQRVSRAYRDHLAGHELVRVSP